MENRMESQNNLVSNFSNTVDFTLLDARATFKDIEKLCEIAYKNEYYSVCVNPCNVAYAKGFITKNLLGALKVTSVVGFPLGANTTEAKVFEAKKAVDDGADEIDVVINIAKALSHDFDYVKNELVKIKKAVKGKVVKAIFETCYLTENDIISLCKVAVKAKVDYVKTSTGFGTGGATLGNVSLMKKCTLGKCKVKASGGIRTRQQAIEFLNAGADRIGTSHIL